MKISSAFPSKYLKAADLGGSPMTVRITGISTEDLGGNGRPEDQKPVLHLEGQAQGFGLNKTNAKAIATALGDETDGWIGQSIELYPTETDYQGDRVECIRVRIPSATLPGSTGFDSTTTTMTFDEAIKKCGDAGIGEPDLVIKLKESGFSAWNSDTCTPIAQKLIASKAPVTEDDIPF